MVTRRARSLFSVLLAFALLPLVSMAAAGAADARAHAAMAWMQWQAKSQSPPVQSVRAGLGEMAVHHAADTPFEAAEPFSLGLSARTSATTVSTPRVVAAITPTRLHPARAPPALL